MSRYIDADVLMLRVNCHGTNKYGVLHDVDIRAFIDEQPTVDAVHVVRCGECKYWNRFTRVTFKYERKGLCEYHGHIMASQEDFFCSDGERKDGERRSE